MATSTSPALTSSSHTLTGLPVIPGPSLPSSSADRQILALLDSLRPERRHVFLRPSDALPTEALGVVRDTLEGFAGQVGDRQQERLKESRSRKRKRGDGAAREEEPEVLKLRKVFVDGFETGQVWQQAKRIIGSVLEFSGGLLEEMEERELVVAGGAGEEEEVIGTAEDEEEDDDDGEEEEEEDDDDDDDDEEEEEEDLYLLEDEEDDGGPEDGVDDEEVEDEGAGEQDVDDEDDEEDEEEGGEFVEDPNGLNDGFFSIDEFNKQTQWFEERDARGDPNTDRASDDEDIDWDADPFAEPQDGKKKKASRRGDGDEEDGDAEQEDSDDDDDGPTFGDMDLDAPEGDSEDEDLDDQGSLDNDDEANDFNANGVYYKDFFAPPPKKSKGPKPRKAVRFEAHPPPAKEDVERAMADVRRDLFDDESDNAASDDDDDALSDVSAGDPRSRRSAHERRQAKLAEEIRRLEAASVAKREWTLSGEAAAADRPVNSLLEEDLDFEHVGKPVPVITPEVTEGIEDLIKRRILAQQFDEVLRRRPGAESEQPHTRRGMVELDDSKATKSLADIYEEEHVKNTNPDTYVSAADEKLQKEEREVEAMWKSVCAGLDALSSWHYKPKPAAPTLSVVADVAAVSMEDAQPSTGLAVLGEGSRMAPQEVYKPGSGSGSGSGGKNGGGGEEVVTTGGMPLARQEMTREDKARRRRRDKERARKAGPEGVAAGQKGQKIVSGKAKMQRDTMAELKKGGVKVINRKGEITDIEGNKAKAAKAASSGNFKL